MVYDPVKRREYYLKTRQLKGRAPAQSKPGAKDRIGPSSQTKVRSITKSNDYEQRRKAAAEKQAALRNRLAKLKEILARLVEEARKKSSSSSSTSTSSTSPKSKSSTSKSSSSSSSKSEPKTAAEKKKDTEYSKEYRKKHPTPSSSSSSTPTSPEIRRVQAQIREIQRKLREAAKAPKKADVASTKTQIVERR